MITIIANFKVKDDSISQFKRAALDCVRETRKEKGNIAYKIYQERNNSGHFTFFEEWLNDTAIDGHNKAVHFKKFLDTIMPMCEEDPEITQMSAVPSVY